MAGAAGNACGLSASPIGPADLEGGMSVHGYRVLGGPVQPRVTRVEVLLADGQRLNLHPAAAYGHRWSATEYTGPWGRCFAVPGASDCVEGAGPQVEAGRLTLPMFSVPDGVHLVSVVPDVASMRLDLSSGQQLRVVTRAGYGGQRFYAFLLPHGVKVQGWTAYDSAGVKLGSGPGSTAG
jgi:catechol 2,3-dioxygenase-like lactoylglutathione lyase family enzyme